MNDVAQPGDLTMHWIPVVDAHGHTHMEAHWSVVPDAHTPLSTGHAA